MFEFELPEKFRRYVPLLAWLVVAAVLLAIPLKIISYGYLPSDDALRHCAKAVSGKPWPEILVVGDNFKLDHNLGWHTLLGAVHHATGWGAENLVVFSVVALFIVFNFAALPWLKRPEAWLVGLLAAAVTSGVTQRLMLGRPFVMTMAAVLVVLLAAQRLKPGGRAFVLCASLIAAAAYVHGVWYLWLLALAAFLFAGQFRWTLLLAGAWLTGVAGAALLTGHPVDYLTQAFAMGTQATSGPLTNRTLVTEFRPFTGEILSVALLGILVLLRGWLKPAALPFVKNPAFWLVCGCWILSFRVGRFWDDWGWPALLVLIVSDLQWLFARIPADSLRRLWLVLILAAATFAGVTSDYGDRWTQSLTWQFLTPDVPEMAGWMPGKGGVIYSAQMDVFYRTFFKNPNGDWKYILGYEPWLMPTEDYATYQKILWNYGAAKAYAPWVNKMKPADRLVITGNSDQRPNIPQLEWNYGVSGLWIGRLPQTK